MKNHFYMSYAGNKRKEIANLYEFINFDNIKCVIEPYAGSQAMSYYIWTKHPDIEFILNDNNKFLKEMYEIIIDENKLEEFEETINIIIPTITNDNDDSLIEKCKEEYNKIIKRDDVIGWFIKNKIYNIRPGLYPTGKSNIIKPINIKSYHIYEFYKNAKITFLNEDGLDIYMKYKDDKQALLLLDPPYLGSCNNFYLHPSLNIYEYLTDNIIKKEKAKIYLILEKTFITKILFKKFIINEYDKKYETTNKKTQHIIISNCN